MPIYMNWGASTPPKIQGDVTAAGHVGWIELSSAQVGLPRHPNSSVGGVERDAPPQSEIVVTKEQDNSSTSLYKASLWGEGTPVQIDFVKPSANGPDVYLTIKLNNVLLSNFSVSGHGGSGHGTPMESIVLNSTKATWGAVPAVTPHTTGPRLRTAP
jgi:type VI secretion system Hcp family effector